ncbi:Glutamyl-tRNA(Gln) amidotransferase subunit A [Geodia barretti]|uniref:Glutamyl-tRNA(Gln) amidotransferase subunit A n=1 Tax=Geodia barretti TaxID=519541 RepID=A0AA35W901_GEOBA|nr:Glutamyl-tRNA(Gln) amidotransferase subunit A [Geodia barretti]
MAHPGPDYRQSLDGDVKGMKIGVIKERADSQDVEPDIKEAVDRAISLLEQMGASIEEVSIPLIDYSTVIFQAISRMEAANVHGAGSENDSMTSPMESV